MSLCGECFRNVGFVCRTQSRFCFGNVLGLDVLCSDLCIDNRRFVEVIVKSRKRFEALRDFTVEGALAEVDRIARERKDAGEPTGIMSPIRNASIDSARSPATARSSALGNVPEDSAFAIGDDEDDEEESTVGVSTPMSASTSVVDDAVPLQSRSMSEKARGKQPVNQTSFSRTNSRNTSNASLTALNTLQTSTSPQPFAPTPEWVSPRACISVLLTDHIVLTGCVVASYLSTTPTTTHHPHNHLPFHQRRPLRSRGRGRRRRVRPLLQIHRPNRRISQRR